MVLTNDSHLPSMDFDQFLLNYEQTRMRRNVNLVQEPATTVQPCTFVSCNSYYGYVPQVNSQTEVHMDVDQITDNFVDKRKRQYCSYEQTMDNEFNLCNDITPKRSRLEADHPQHAVQLDVTHVNIQNSIIDHNMESMKQNHNTQETVQSAPVYKYNDVFNGNDLVEGNLLNSSDSIDHKHSVVSLVTNQNRIMPMLYENCTNERTNHIETEPYLTKCQNYELPENRINCTTLDCLMFWHTHGSSWHQIESETNDNI